MPNHIINRKTNIYNFYVSAEIVHIRKKDVRKRTFMDVNYWSDSITTMLRAMFNAVVIVS